MIDYKEKIIERRGKPRIECDYPVVAEGLNGNGIKFCENAKLANLSASGSYMIINRSIDKGNILSMTIFLINNLDDEDTPKISTNGTVVRTENLVDGSFGIAIKFNHYRFL